MEPTAAGLPEEGTQGDDAGSGEIDLLGLAAASPPPSAQGAAAVPSGAVDLLAMFSPPAGVDADSTSKADLHEQGSPAKPSMRIELDPEAVSDAAIMSALGGEGGGTADGGAAGSDLPIDAQQGSPAKPSMRIELDPEAVSDAAIAAALGGADPETATADLPIDAQEETPDAQAVSASSNSSSPSNDLLRASLGITTLDPDSFIPPAAAVGSDKTAPAQPPSVADRGAEPVCLVEQDGERLRVAPEGLALLQSLGSSPVAVITVAGNYRTGKSFFLNQLAGVKPRKQNDSSSNTSTTSGFHVGHDTESCTRGVWVWLVPAEVWSHPADPTVRLLLMDTEGLASIDQDETWDAKVFSLGILLSSIFVYNNMGVIDEGAIDRLFLVGELTKNICVSANQHLESSEGGSRPEDEANSSTQPEQPGQTEAELAEFFPPFMWLLRDFSLHMKKGGETISHSQYLEQALANRPGTSSRIAAGNRIRTSFRTLFSDRQCCTLVRPAVDEDSLRNLATLDQSQLRPEFVSEMAALREDLLGRVVPKEMYGEQVTATMLGALTQAYTDAINDGGIPDIKKSWNYVIEETLRQAHDSAVTTLRDNLQTLSTRGADSGKLPTALEFSRAAHSLHAAAHEQFNGNCGSIASSGEAQPWRSNLDKAFGKMYDQSYQQLQNASTIACTDLLLPLLLNILEDPIAQGCFDSADGKAATAAAMMGQAVTDQLLAQYEQQAHGPATASTVASTLVARLPALYTNLARRADTTAEQAVAAAENAAHVERRQAETLREALNASIQAEALVSARLEMLEKSLDELQQETTVRATQRKSVRARARARV